MGAEVSDFFYYEPNFKINNKKKFFFGQREGGGGRGVVGGVARVNELFSQRIQL